MVRSFSEVVAWATANPQPHQGGSWNLRCEQFVNNAGGFTYGFDTAALDYQSAKAAGNLVGPGDLPIPSVPTGWLLFWDYASSGHVGFKAPGNKSLMASSFLDEPFGDSSVGYVIASDYQTKTGHRYLGASPWHGPETLNGVSMLTSADKTWIANAIAEALQTQADASDIATAVWTYKTKSSFSNSQVPVLPQLMAARKDSNHAAKVVDQILEEIHTPGE